MGMSGALRAARAIAYSFYAAGVSTPASALALEQPASSASEDKPSMKQRGSSKDGDDEPHSGVDVADDAEEVEVAAGDAAERGSGQSFMTARKRGRPRKDAVAGAAAAPVAAVPIATTAEAVAPNVKRRGRKPKHPRSSDRPAHSEGVRSDVEADPSNAASVPKRRGRPPGSGKKVKPESIANEGNEAGPSNPHGAEPPLKRKRGRPPGIKKRTLRDAAKLGKRTEHRKATLTAAHESKEGDEATAPNFDEYLTKLADDALASGDPRRIAEIAVLAGKANPNILAQFERQ